MNAKFPTLLSPLRIGTATLKNRMLSAPMSAKHLTVEGYMTPETIRQYELLAKGGVALVNIGESLVHSKTGNNHGRVLRLDDPGVLPGLYACTDAIHRHGALASVELVHPGRRADPQYNDEGKTYGPSGGQAHYGEGGHQVTELTEELIDVIANAFGDAAEMAMMAGCDMVMLHAGHGWLLNQFLSPANNQRTDRFGGSIENRARFTLMCLDNIRQKCGPAFPIDVRISGDDFMEDGATQADIIELAKMLDERVNSIHVSATSFHSRKASIRMFPSMLYPRGVNAFLAEEIKKHVAVPVITVGGFNDPAHMESLLSTGKADGIAMARALLADPFLPDKVRTGREGDITGCVRCNNCISVSFVPYVKYNLGVAHCSVNPWFGLQSEYLTRQVPTGNQNVLVIGGGPGGMQAALGAAECGHSVTLCEKSGSLGGMLRHACHPDFKKDVGRYIETLKCRMEENPNISVRLNTEVTPGQVKNYGADAVIVAVGGKPVSLSLPGMDDPRVVQAIDLHTTDRELGQSVVIIGAGQVGMEEGISLAQAGKDVTIVEMGGKAASDSVYIHYLALLTEAEGLPNLKIKLETKCTGVDPGGVQCVTGDGQSVVYPADTIISAVGMSALRAEAEAYLDTASQVTLVGDCSKVTRMAEAVLTGYFAGYHLHP